MNDFTIYEFSAYENGEKQQYFSAAEVLAALASKLAPSDLYAAIMALPLPRSFDDIDLYGKGGHVTSVPAYTAAQMRALLSSAAALAASVHVPVVQEWISVKDQLPEIKDKRSTRVHVLAAYNYTGEVSEMSFVPSDIQFTPPQWFYLGGRRARFSPTHWMELPAAPVSHSDDKGE